MSRRMIDQGARISGGQAKDTAAYINTDNMISLSVHNTYTVALTTAKTFIAGVASTRIIGDITYTGVNRYGPSGNAVSIRYIAGATAGSEVVTVVGNAVTVQIAAGVSTATQVKAKWDASAPAVALATAAITGTAGAAQAVAAVGNLTGGTGQVDIIGNLIQSVAHGFTTGRKFALTTAGTLPTGLSAQDYYAVVLSADTLQFATSLANAIAAVPVVVDLTGIGAGTSTMTPAALASCTLKLQESNDISKTGPELITDWTDIASMSSSITVTGSSVFKPNIDCKWIKISFAIATGQVDLTCNVFGKGD